MSEETPKQREMFTINTRKFYSDSVTQQGANLIKNIGIVEGEMAKTQLTLDIEKLAKDSLVTQLEAIQDQFEEVQEVQEIPEVETTEKAAV